MELGVAPAWLLECASTSLLISNEKSGARSEVCLLCRQWCPRRQVVHCLVRVRVSRQVVLASVVRLASHHEEVVLLSGHCVRSLKDVPADDVVAIRHGVSATVTRDVDVDAQGLGHQLRKVDVHIKARGRVGLPVEEGVRRLTVINLEKQTENRRASGAHEVAIVKVVADDLHLEIVARSIDQVFGRVVETNLVRFPVHGAVV